MKIEAESKYNIGDELFYVDWDLKIYRKVVESVSFVMTSEGPFVKYRFTDGDCTNEKYMTYYGASIEEAADLAAKRAIERFNQKETN